MRKNRILFIFTLFMFFCLANSVNAAYWCKYGPDYGGTGEFSAKFKVGSDGYAPEVEYTLDSGGTDIIENWQQDIGDSKFNGKLFQAANKCPEYIFFVEKGVAHGWGDTCLYPLTEQIYISGYIGDVSYYNDTVSAIYDNFCVTKFRVSNLVSQPVIEEDSVIGYPNSCLEFPKSPTLSADKCVDSADARCYACESNPYFSCLWVKKDGQNGYCNVDDLQYIKCGDSYDLPHEVPKLISLAVNLLKIGVPIILIITSMITLIRALTASKEDEIKKAQSSLVKKLIVSVLTFFIISIVQFVVLKVADDGEAGNLNDCMSCLLNNDCNESLYYKTTNNGGENICTYISGGTFNCFDN